MSIILYTDNPEIIALINNYKRAKELLIGVKKFIDEAVYEDFHTEVRAQFESGKIEGFLKDKE